MAKVACAVLAASMLVLAVPAEAQSTSCPGVRHGAPRGEIERYFALRAVQIMQAGIAGDTARLRTMVSPQATFAIWRGDAGGGRLKGADGVIEMVRQLQPRGYQFTAGFDGPIAVTRFSCSAQADVLVRVEGDLPGVAMKFTFEDDILVSVTGSYVNLVEGSFQ